MARSEHNREAYRLLFGYVGGGLQALAGLLTLFSVPIAPLWLSAVLLIFIAATSWWSWRRYDSNFMMPTFAGTMQAVSWMLLVGVGVGILRWGR
ncbi:MAG: hypothetical protein ACC683_12005 [Acidimicrobiia bacterium]